MATVLDYLDWRGDLPFPSAPFCEVDNLILSLLAYFDFSGPEFSSDGQPLVLREAAERYIRLHPRKKDALGILLPDQLFDLLEKAGKSRRFGPLRLWAHENRVDENREMQFSATTFSLDSRMTFVAFRGTDDTIVGWKEDFNMSYRFPVPAQVEAARYLDRIAGQTTGPILVGGHSKGGNLAIYAATFCAPDIQPRIRRVWSNDGPGFFPEVLATPQYRAIRSRVCAVLPRSAIVGMILDSDSEAVIVESSAVGPLQHDGMTWQVMGPAFVRAAGLSRSSRQADRTFHSLVREMAPEQRREFTETLFSACKDLGARTLSDLTAGDRRGLLRVMGEKISNFDKGTRESFFRALRAVLRTDEESGAELPEETKS